MLASRRIARFAAAAFVTLQFAPALIGQPILVGPTLPGQSTQQAPTEPVADKRAENAEQLRIALRKMESGGTANTTAAQDVAYYQTREALFAQQEAVEQQIKDLEARKAELDSKLKSPAAQNSAAVSFVELDGMKDELASEQVRAKLIGDKLSAAKAAVEKAKAALEDSEVKYRQAQSALDSGKDGPDVAALSSAAEQAHHAAGLAAENLALKRREVDREQLAGDVQSLSIRLRKEQVERLSPQVVFSEADFQKQVDDIKSKEESANKTLSKAQASLQNITFKLRDIQQRFDAATGDKAILAEELEAQRRAREKSTEEIDSLTQRLQQLAQLRVGWNQRYKIASAKRDQPDKSMWAELKSLQKETKSILDGLASDLSMQILRMRELRSSLTSVTKKAEAAEAGPEALRTWIDYQANQLELTLRIREKNLVTIETSRRVHEKLLEEIGSGVEAFSPKTVALSAWYQAYLVWKHELGHIDKDPITVGNVVTGVTILAIGWMMARFLAAMFAVRLLKRFRLSKDATSAIRSLVFYSLLSCVVLSALKTVNVPLTAFTILGGALAIGVGFGSQALINNFIGGLIMLAERPVRLGERITFGNFDGVVEDVGFRCTKLRTQSDHLVTIPNSTLVNEAIENVDRRRTIRRLMNIQITYNTSREMIAAGVQAIRDILEEKEIRERIHPIVGFEEFPPRVYFTDYNAESLNIQMCYWYAPVDCWAYMEHCERVNYRIMEEFERLGVEFAFPSKTAYVKNSMKRSGGGKATDSYAA